MSRREGRDSQGKRLHSRFDGDPSPKRSRHDRPTSERTCVNRDDLEIPNKGHQTKWDQKHSRRLEDASTLEASPAPEKAQADSINKEMERKADPPPDRTKPFSDHVDVPKSRSYFQHDERGIAGQGGRSFGRRATEPRGWRNRGHPKERSSDKAEENLSGLDPQERDQKVSDTQRKDKGHARYDDRNSWRHDRYHQSEVAAPPARRRPAFRENKLATKEPEDAAGAGDAAVEPTREERLTSGSARREERGHHPREQGIPERTLARADNRNGRGDGSSWRGEARRPGYQHQQEERLGPGGRGLARGRDGYEGRHREGNRHQFVGNQVERWKHDLYDEANRSPTPKNEEDQIAKIEALLAL